MKIYRTLAILLGFGLATTMTLANSYYLVGTDEDGCDLTNPSSCLCMPIDPPPAAQGSYCMDLNDVSCKPYRPGMSCDQIFPPQSLPTPQAACLVVAFESTPGAPACKAVSQATCTQHHVAICARDGGQHTCKSS